MSPLARPHFAACPFVPMDTFRRVSPHVPPLIPSGRRRGARGRPGARAGRRPAGAAARRRPERGAGRRLHVAAAHVGRAGEPAQQQCRALGEGGGGATVLPEAWAPGPPSPLGPNSWPVATGVPRPPFRIGGSSLPPSHTSLAAGRPLPRTALPSPPRAASAATGPSRPSVLAHPRRASLPLPQVLPLDSPLKLAVASQFFAGVCGRETPSSYPQAMLHTLTALDPPLSADQARSRGEAWSVPLPSPV